MKRVILLTGICIFYVVSFAQTNVGIGTNSPVSKLDVSGALSLREGAALTLGNSGASGGTNDNITLPDITGSSDVASFYRITGPTAVFSVYGIAPATNANGQIVTLINTTGKIMTIVNNGSSTAVNDIATQTGANLVDNGNSSITLQYNKSVSKWYVTASQNFVISNAQLGNSAITVTPSTGIGVSGSPVSLGGTLTLSNTGVTSITSANPLTTNTSATGGVTVNLTGTVPITNGGTAATTAAAALTSLGAAPSSGSGNYIQNGTSAQSANFNVTGTGTVSGGLTVGTYQSADVITGTLGIYDTRSTNPVPDSYNMGLIGEFKLNSSDGLNDGGSYNGVLTLRQWSSGTDWSGGGVHQLAMTDNGDIYTRFSSSTTTWGNWYQLAQNQMTNTFSFMGDLGIGTTTPQYLSDINGNQMVRGGLITTGGMTSVTDYSTSGSVAFSYTSSSLYTGTPEIFVNGDNHTGGGIAISDDGGFYDWNDGYITYQGSTGLRIAGSSGASSTGALLLEGLGTGILKANSGTVQLATASDLSSLANGSFILNQTGLQSSSNFNISGNGYIAGNVGIGTTGPGNKLDVEGGNMDASGYVMAGGTGGGAVLFAGTNAASVTNSAWGAGGCSFYGRPRIGDWGNWLTIGEPAGDDGGMVMQIEGGAIYTGISPSLGGALTYHNTLDNGSGSVGIGTTSPNNTLEVNGAVRVDANPIYLNNGVDNNYYIQINNSAGGNQNGPMIAGYYGAGWYSTAYGQWLGQIYDEQICSNRSCSYLSASGWMFVDDIWSQRGGNWLDNNNDLDAIDAIKPMAVKDSSTGKTEMVNDPSTLPFNIAMPPNKDGHTAVSLTEMNALSIGAIRELRHETKTHDEAQDARIDRLEKLVSQLTGKALGQMEFVATASAYKGMENYVIMDARVSSKSIITIEGLNNYEIINQTEGSFEIKFKNPPAEDIKFTYSSKF